MQIKGKVAEFEWDKWNLNKSYFKHGVTPKETEEVFFDETSLILPDLKHSQDEKRFIVVGKTLGNNNLFIAFVFRKEKVRVISARRMHREEVLKYEKFKIKKGTKI